MPYLLPPHIAAAAAGTVTAAAAVATVSTTVVVAVFSALEKWGLKSPLLAYLFYGRHIRGKEKGKRERNPFGERWDIGFSLTLNCF